MNNKYKFKNIIRNLLPENFNDPCITTQLEPQGFKGQALQWARIFAIGALMASMLTQPLTNFCILLTLFAWVLSGCYLPFPKGFFQKWCNYAEKRAEKVQILEIPQEQIGQVHYVEKLRNLFENPAVQGAVLLLGWIILSAAWALVKVDISLVANGAWKYRKLLWLVLMVILFEPQVWRLRAIKYWAIAASFLMIYALFKFLLPDTLLPPDVLVEPAWPFSHYSYLPLAFMLIPAVSLGLGWLTMSDKSNHRLLGAFLVVLTVVYVFWGQIGRTTYLTLLTAVSMFLLMYLKRKTRWMAILVMAGMVLLVYAVNPKVQIRVHQVVTELEAAQTPVGLNTSSGLRLHFWRGSYEIFKENPLLGAGIGTWASEFRRYIERNPGSPNIAPTGGNPHQEYLMMASQLGFIGLALFIFWLYKLFKASWFLAPIFRIAVHSVLAIFVMGCFLNSGLYDSPSGHFFCLAIGILFSGWQTTNYAMSNAQTSLSP